MYVYNNETAFKWNRKLRFIILIDQTNRQKSINQMTIVV